MVEQDGYCIVVDSGPDFRQQMLRNRVTRLDALLLTHEHKDHIAGLDDVRAFNYLQNRSMPVYSLSRVLERIKIEFAYAFAEVKYPGVPRIDLEEIGQRPFQLGPILVRPIPVMHARLPILGFRFGDFSYVTDCNFLSDEAKAIIQGSKVLVLSALQREPHISHYTLNEALEMTRELGIPKTYFIHMSHKLGTHREIEKELPPGVFLSHDGLQLEL